MSKKIIILTVSLIFFLASFFILQDLAYAQEDWCYIKNKAEELSNYRPKNFQECKDWLRETGKLLASHTQAINSSGTVQNPQCKGNDTEKSVNKIKSMIESINELAIDYSTESIPSGWKEIVRFAKKNARPDKIALTVIGGSITVALGGAPAIVVAGVTASAGIELAKERVGVLEEDGFFSPNQAQTSRFYLSVTEMGVSLALLSGGISPESIAMTAGEIGVNVYNIKKTSDGYYSFKASSDGVSQIIKLKLPAEPNKEKSRITITFPYIKIAKHNIEDISGTLSLTRDDLKNKAIEIRGRINDGANGGNTRKVQVNIGTGSGWEEASGRMTWKYSFIPRENYDYRLKIRAIDLSGKEHKSLFGTIRLIYTSVDDETLVRQVLYEIERAYQDEDVNRFMSFFTKDFIHRPKNLDWNGFRDNKKSTFDNNENINMTLSNVDISVTGNMARVSFIIEFNMIKSSTKALSYIKEKNIFRFKKINGTWKATEFVRGDVIEKRIP